MKRLLGWAIAVCVQRNTQIQLNVYTVAILDRQKAEQYARDNCNALFPTEAGWKTTVVSTGILQDQIAQPANN